MRTKNIKVSLFGVAAFLLMTVFAAQPIGETYATGGQGQIKILYATCNTVTFSHPKHRFEPLQRDTSLSYGTSAGIIGKLTPNSPTLVSIHGGAYTVNVYASYKEWFPWAPLKTDLIGTVSGTLEECTVTPETPTRGEGEADKNTITIPAQDGVIYTLEDGTVITDPTITLKPKDVITITAIADEANGYVLAEGAGTGPWTFEFMPTIVTPNAPTRGEGETDKNIITIPTKEGVIYSIEDGFELTPQNPTVTVRATAVEGYKLEGTVEWTFEFVPTIVTPEAPKQDGNTITIPEIEGVIYTSEDKEYKPGDVIVLTDKNKTVKITAKAAEGYELLAGETAEWTFNYTAPKPEIVPPVVEDENMPVSLIAASAIAAPQTGAARVNGAIVEAGQTGETNNIAVAYATIALALIYVGGEAVKRFNQTKNNRKAKQLLTK